MASGLLSIPPIAAARLPLIAAVLTRFRSLWPIRPVSGWRLIMLMVSSAFGVLTGLAQSEGREAAIAVDRLEFRYGREHPELPALSELQDLMFRPANAEGAVVTFGKLQPGTRLTATDLQHIAESVVAAFNRQGIFGVWVAYEDLELSGGELVDLRAEGEQGLRMTIWASQVAELRTLARGSRIRASAAQDHRKHRWIAHRSPAQPPSGPFEPGGLFRRDEIEAYLRLLSAHPGRRVEASIASAGEPGLIVLDYLVTELRSWQVYSQISNTGTETTGRWRGRLGFQHNQLTNYDDVLSLDLLSTANAENVAGFVSYRRPLFRPGSFSARIYGSFGDFAASGTAFENLRFVGDNWMAGAEIMHRRALGRAWDLSLALGANYTVYSVATTVSGVNITRGESPFLVPFFNAALARETDWWSIAGGLRVEHSIDGVADDNPATGYRSLGRTGATAEWTSIRTAVDFRIFLEPLFSRKSPPSTLAHEAAVRVRGRFLPTGGRLVPQEQELMGGAYSVRGYPESVASADEAITFSAEYAYHVPRSLRSGERGTLLGRPFAWRPPQPLRRPDWDLILRGFVDYGHRWVEPAPNSRREDPPPLIERNLALLGVGGGVEVTVKHYVSLRCDIGFALNELKDEDNTWARAGEARAHLTASFHW